MAINIAVPKFGRVLFRDICCDMETSIVVWKSEIYNVL